MKQIPSMAPPSRPWCDMGSASKVRIYPHNDTWMNFQANIKHVCTKAALT